MGLFLVATSCSVFSVYSVEKISSSAVSQGRRHRIDRKLDAFAHASILLAGAMPLEQLHLQQIERLDVRQAQPDRFVELRLFLEQPRLAGDGEERVVGRLPGGAYALEDAVGEGAILN